MPALNPALVAINKRNKDYWSRQRQLLSLRMADHAVREAAFEILRAESVRGVLNLPPKCIYEACEEAAKFKAHFASFLGRTGGQAKRRDALQTLIGQIVATNPNITAAKLIEALHQCQEARKTIQDIESNKIIYLKEDGRMGEAPLSGLKDRLYRAKKTVNSRKPVAATEPK